jgi:hypothetical protein
MSGLTACFSQPLDQIAAQLGLVERQIELLDQLADQRDGREPRFEHGDRPIDQGDQLGGRLEAVRGPPRVEPLALLDRLRLEITDDLIDGAKKANPATDRAARAGIGGEQDRREGMKRRLSVLRL